MEVTEEQFIENLNGMPEEEQQVVLGLMDQVEMGDLETFAKALGVTVVGLEEEVEQPAEGEEAPVAEEPVPTEPVPAEPAVEEAPAELASILPPPAAPAPVVVAPPSWAARRDMLKKKNDAFIGIIQHRMEIARRPPASDYDQ